MGSKNQGQGHETTFKQVLTEKLGIDPTNVQYIDGDTDRVAFGIGTNGSRSTVIGGSALWMAADKIIAKGKSIAAHLLEAAEADIEFAVSRWGQFHGRRHRPACRSPRSRRRRSSAGRLPPGLEGGLYETGTFAPDDFTYPNGCHVCEVEIDPDTGALEIVHYVVVDDVGTVINPLGLKGQIHGGVAQGLGQALMEQVVYDRESGQMLTGSFMDYAMPRADTMPSMEITSNPVPTKRNPLGAKGAGEAGTVGALPAIVNAVIDALAPLGVKSLDMPATSAAHLAGDAGRPRLTPARHARTLEIAPAEISMLVLGGVVSVRKHVIDPPRREFEHQPTSRRILVSRRCTGRWPAWISKMVGPAGQDERLRCWTGRGRAWLFSKHHCPALPLPESGTASGGEPGGNAHPSGTVRTHRRREPPITGPFIGMLLLSGRSRRRS